MSAQAARPLRSLEDSEHTSAPLALEVPEALVEHLAARVAARLADRLPSPRDGYLDVEGAAEYLACPRSRVYELVAARRVRHFRDGRRVLFRREDLDAALRVREVEA